MTIRVALHHKTSYTYDRLVSLGPQIVRLRPAPHCRTPIRSYSLKVEPEGHFLNWQQDPHGNFLARLVFPQQTKHFSIAVDLIADMTVVNPFDFFLDEYAEKYPFQYEAWLSKELLPFLDTDEVGPRVKAYLKQLDYTPRRSIDFLVDLNCRLQQDIKYLIRMEPGVQEPEETLRLRSGSCWFSSCEIADWQRDSFLVT
jgi:transglutaminase-like putative cysteine protease